MQPEFIQQIENIRFDQRSPLGPQVGLNATLRDQQISAPFDEFTDVIVFVGRKRVFHAVEYNQIDIFRNRIGQFNIPHVVRFPQQGCDIVVTDGLVVDRGESDRFPLLINQLFNFGGDIVFQTGSRLDNGDDFLFGYWS